MDSHILDSAVWAALNGPQSTFAEIYGRARRFPVDVSPFCAIANQKDAECWQDLATLVGPGGQAVLTGNELSIPDNWEVLSGGTGKQMIGDSVVGEADLETVSLSLDDVPEMLDLISRTQPGPFLPRTVELGGYLGIRVDGALVAMAGRRINPPGWVEISAVCTDANFQGRGYGRRLVNAAVADIRSGGQLPFLHVSESNTNAIRLYERLGFRTRVSVSFKVLRAPLSI